MSTLTNGDEEKNKINFSPAVFFNLNLRLKSYLYSDKLFDLNVKFDSL